MHHARGAGDVERLLAAAPPRGLIARGLGRSYGDAAQNAGGWVMDVRGLAGAPRFEGDCVTVAAGTSIGEVVAAGAPRGLFPAVTPGTRHVTVGGAIASDVHGKNHHLDGGFCEHVEWIELQTPAGERLWVSPQDDPDVFWATAGGMGLTGVILSARLRLRRIETSRLTVDVERASDVDDLMDRMERGDAGYRYSVAWIDCLARGRSLGRSVLMRGDHARRQDLTPQDRGQPLGISFHTPVPAPAWAPSGLLSSASVRAFNELWFRRAPIHPERRVEGVEGFFYPLDMVQGWNRLYGPRGFLQYQFVVPFGEENVVRFVLERLSSARCASFLAVLKRLGGRERMMSFPIPGWTLAVDLPAGSAPLGKLLGELDQTVADAGGRVYLAKDSRLRPELLEPMYPAVRRWREVCAHVDPDVVLRSDLARRLSLTGVFSTALAA